MTTKQLMPAIGCEATLSVESFSLRVVVRDSKQAYGRTRYQVEPVAGSGRQWVDESRLEIDQCQPI